MNFNLTKPYANCPFRSDKHFYLTPERAKEIATAIVNNQGAFPCHKTVDYSSESSGVETKKTEHCAGALIMLQKMGRPNQLMRIGMRIGFYKPEKLVMDSPVYEHADDFIEAMSEL